MMAFLGTSVGHGFMNEWQMGLVKCGQEMDPLLASLVQEAGLSSAADLSRI